MRHKIIFQTCLVLTLFTNVSIAYAITPPTSADINETFRNSSLNTIDDTINRIKPDNAPNIFSNTTKNDRETGGIPTILSLVSGIIASVASLVAILNILLNSYNYIISKGEPAKTGKAIKAISWSLIGLIGIILSYNIVYTIIAFLTESINTVT